MSSLGALADALRAAGFEAHVYDATTSLLGPPAIGLEIEHSYPQVVVTPSAMETAEAALDILRVAKEVVPGVCTVLLTSSPTPVAGKPRRDGVVDWVVGDDSGTLPGLLAGLRANGRNGAILGLHAA